jgi:hypothetical protein
LDRLIVPSILLENGCAESKKTAGARGDLKYNENLRNFRDTRTIINARDNNFPEMMMKNKITENAC